MAQLINKTNGFRHLTHTLFLATVMATVIFTTTMSLGCGDDETNTATQEGEGFLTPQTPVPAPEPGPGEPPVTEQESPYGSGLTTPQTVGTILDGVQLLDVRWADHGTFFRIVFDMGTAEGEPMLQPPRAETSLEGDGTELRILLGGVRSISDDPQAQASELPIDDELVTTIRRIPSQDDQALLYVVELSRPAAYALAGIGSPGRIVIDITKS